MPALNCHVGQTFGQLKVIADLPHVPGTKRKSECLCACGKIRVVSHSNLVSRHTLSCGCLHLAHGHNRVGFRSPTYNSWWSLFGRCENPKNAGFGDYGGRGIAVCPRWRDSFEHFLEDMGERPLGMSIERINNDKGYEPGNCRWATAKEQSRNTRRNRRYVVHGVSLVLLDWCLKYDLVYDRVRSRLRYGWPIEKALTLPKNTRKNSRTYLTFPASEACL